MTEKADNWTMRNFRDTLVQADQRGVAIGHFNISDFAALKAVAEAAREVGVPVAVGLSESERKFMGVRETVALIRSIRETHSQPIYLNADHTQSLSGAEEAVRAGFDSVVFDRSELPPERNIAETRQAVEALKSINPDIVVEGEIGYIGSGSEIRDQPPMDLALTTPEEARHFVQETRVDVLSPAVGNMHGLLKSMLAGAAEKRLRIDLIEEIKRAAGVFMTLHGGSGTNTRDLEMAIRAGITVVHVNTDIRVAWRKGLEDALSEKPNEIAPYKILPHVVEAVHDVVLERLKVFNSQAKSLSRSV
jgi:fructose-bisphosphate aldolase class II